MKIITYNINGIRAAINKGLLTWLEHASPDVLCLQEIKAHPEQIDVIAFQELDYQIFIHSAEKRGYSGVAIATKQEPKDIKVGTGIPYIDSEGRVIQADFDEFSVISVYVPSGTNMEERLPYKLQFCEDFLRYIKEVQKEYPKLIISGDFNICHQAIDIHDPVRNATVSGFLPVEREWLSRFLAELKLVDTFRYLHPNEPNHYTWWSYRANARTNNKGWRIDYTLISENLLPYLESSRILSEAYHSDHCPVCVTMNF